jgi:hypothetical protein
MLIQVEFQQFGIQNISQNVVLAEYVESNLIALSFIFQTSDQLNIYLFVYFLYAFTHFEICIKKMCHKNTLFCNINNSCYLMTIKYGIFHDFFF